MDAQIRVKVDEREGSSAGYKFNDWEMRGVPLRIELGPKDVAKNSVVLARRDRPGREGKSFVPQAGPRRGGEPQLWSRFSRRYTTGLWHSARPIRSIRKIRWNSSRRWRRDLRFRFGAEAAIAKRKSRKRPKPRCAASRSSSLADRALASTAENPRMNGPTSRRLTETGS